MTDNRKEPELVRGLGVWSAIAVAYWGNDWHSNFSSAERNSSQRGFRGSGLGGVDRKRRCSP
jgi:hypothetical protein